jgi:NADPH:quinone reductase-like Zn-dependent oxidoreductase
VYSNIYFRVLIHGGAGGIGTFAIQVICMIDL